MRWMALGLAALVVGCGASTPKDETGIEHEVERSRPDRPEWLAAPVCPEGRVCSVGNRTRASTLEHGRTDAFNDALKDFARRLETKAKNRFDQGRSELGLPDVGEAPELDQAIKELYSAASKLKVRDVKTSDFWWRRYRAQGADGRTRYYFDYAVQISMSDAAWRRTVQALLDRERNKAKQSQRADLVRALDDFGKDIFDEE